MEDERTEVERAADGTMLVLSRYVREDSGAIMLRLKSDCSTAVANLHLNVIDHPKPPQGKVEFLELSRKCNKMRWKPLRYNGVDSRATIFPDKKSGGGRAYQYCIRAVKVEGMSDPLETEEVHAGEPLALYDISDGSQVKEASVWALSLSGLLLLQSEWGPRPGDCQGPAARSKSRHQPTSPSSSSLLGYDTIRAITDMFHFRRRLEFFD
ncbi:Immunoglobulin-like and fibronectin type III domain containing protein 1, partial [Dissostichus eleginoides]